MELLAAADNAFDNPSYRLGFVVGVLFVMFVSGLIPVAFGFFFGRPRVGAVGGIAAAGAAFLVGLLGGFVIAFLFVAFIGMLSPPQEPPRRKKKRRVEPIILLEPDFLPDESSAEMVEESSGTDAVLMPEFEDEAIPDSRLPHPGFWWAVLWCLGIFFLVQFFPGMIVGLAMRGGPPQPIESPRSKESKQGLPRFTQSVDSGDSRSALDSPRHSKGLMWTMLFTQSLSILVALLALHFCVGKGWQRAVDLRLPRWYHVVLVLMGLPALLVLNMCVLELAQHIPSFLELEQFMGVAGKWPLPIALLTIGLAPGIGEELWFRGFLGRGLVSRNGVLAGVLLTSLLFAAIHLEPRQATVAFTLGVILHLSYLATRSLLVPILLHVGNNVASVLVLHIPFMADLSLSRIPWYIFVLALLLLVAVGRGLHQSRTRVYAQTKYPDLDMTSHRRRKAADGFAYCPVDRTSWLLAITGFVFFCSAVVPLDLRESARQEEEKKHRPLAELSSDEVAGLLKKEPISAATWPAWSQRLRQCMDTPDDNSRAAFDAARDFLAGEFKNGDLGQPLRDDPLAWYLHGRSYVFRMKNPQEQLPRARTGEMLLRRSIQLDPKFGRAYYGLAVALYLQADPADPLDRRRVEARAAAAEAERLDPRNPASAAEAWAAMMQDRFEDAERLYRTLLQEHPNEVKWGRGLAQAINHHPRRTGSYAAAVGPLLERFPNDGQLICEHAAALARDGDHR